MNLQHCNKSMIRNGTTKAKSQRWRCTVCGCSQTDGITHGGYRHGQEGGTTSTQRSQKCRAKRKLKKIQIQKAKLSSPKNKTGTQRERVMKIAGLLNEMAKRDSDFYLGRINKNRFILVWTDEEIPDQAKQFGSIYVEILQSKPNIIWLKQNNRIAKSVTAKGVQCPNSELWPDLPKSPDSCRGTIVPLSKCKSCKFYEPSKKGACCALSREKRKSIPNAWNS